MRRSRAFGLLLIGGLAGCSAGPETNPAEAPALDGLGSNSPEGCVGKAVETWVGTASRVSSDRYPDDIGVTVTWKRVASEGCVDRYAPTGEAHYVFAIPGAVCRQTIAPDAAPVGAEDGLLVIDRSTTPPTYTADGATSWTVTWTCAEAGGTTTSKEFSGGTTWLEASGDVVDGVITGERRVEDGRQCGNGASSSPCDYVWRFEAAI